MEIKGYKIEHKDLMWLIHRGADAFALVFGYILAVTISNSADVFDKTNQLLFVIVVLVSLIVYPLFDVYRTWRGEQSRKEIQIIVLAWLATMFVSVALGYYTGIVSEVISELLLTWTFCGVVTFVSFRVVVRQFLLRIRKHGFNLRHIVVVGDGEIAANVIKQVNNSKWTGYSIVGYFADKNLDVDASRLGEVEQLKSLIEKNEVNCDQIWLAFPLSEVERIKEIIKVLELSTKDIRYIPDLSSFNLINHSVTSVAGIPFINVSISPMTGLNKIVKEVEDKFIAALILVLVFPIMALIAIAIKFTSRGPIFYFQERVGWNNKPFRMIKFRSMAVDAEVSGIEWGGASSMKVTKVGRFLRSTSLDELPQFFNVLLGDMSIVGPRPERTVFVEKFKYEIPGYMQKHMVKAGITGLAQIRGWRGDSDLNNRIQSDLEYIRNWSVWIDIKIILLTIFKGFNDKNAC